MPPTSEDKPGDKIPQGESENAPQSGVPEAGEKGRPAKAVLVPKGVFYFVLNREGFDTTLELASYRHIVPDFRRFTGAVREVLREFIQAKEAGERFFSFGIECEADKKKKNIVRNPHESLIELALDAKLLKNKDGALLSGGNERRKAAVKIEDLAGQAVLIKLILLDEEGNEQTGKFEIISRRFVLAGDKLYRLLDLGGRWAETERLDSRLMLKELPMFLSGLYSAFTNIELRYEGWSIKKARPVATENALLFMEIDTYNYLHVEPIPYLRGFPPRLFENTEIVNVVRMNEAEKTLLMSEVVFEQSPEDEFRSMLLRSGKSAEIKKSIHEENGKFIIEPELALKFFSENIIELSRRFILLETKVLAGYKIRFARPKVRLSIKSGINFLEADGEFEAKIEMAGQDFSFSSFMDQYRSESCITLADGTRAIPDERSMRRMERLLSTIGTAASGEDQVELSYFDIPVLLENDDIEIEGESWDKARPFFTNYNSISKQTGHYPIAVGSLRPYQEYGVRWLNYLREYKMGACLADEMGLGKTVQVIALLRQVYREWCDGGAGNGENADQSDGVVPEAAAPDSPAPAHSSGVCLILCPKSLVFNWKAELERFAPELRCEVYYGTERDISSFNTKGFRIILSTYATLRRDIETLKELNFYYIILDESQNIKNLSSQTTHAVLSLNSEHRLAMSGTPVENNLADLYSLFRFLNPRFFNSQKQFLERYLHPIQDNNDEDALHDLKLRIYPFILRRLKRDVLRDLPEKSEEVAYIELEEEHLKIYHKRRLQYKEMISGIVNKGEYEKSAFIIFKALSQLRRIASVPESDGEYAGLSAKRQYLLDKIAELTENGHKCLVFTNFLASVELVSKDLEAMGIQNITMTGASSDRQSLVHRFQTDGEIKAFIMTLKTGGAGLNLTAADYIFILDPWWNIAAESQAIDRSHRIGQKNPVFCYRLIAKDTIEERILELQKRKQDLAQALLSDDTGSLKSLSADDVEYLIGDE